MSALYIAAVVRLGNKLDDIEQRLATTPANRTIDSHLLRRMPANRVLSAEEVRLVQEALRDIGILTHTQAGYAIDRQVLLATEGFRRGIRAGLASRDVQRDESAMLCAALPPTLDASLVNAIQREATDLRATILEVIVSARSHVVIASPFWDSETAAEFAELCGRRSEAGVSIDFLGRFNDSERNIAPLLNLSKRRRSVRLLSWFETAAGDRFGSETFHFKAVVADRGLRAYLGTANLTLSSLRSRMELGVLLNGRPAESVYRILDLILPLASPIAD